MEKNASIEKQTEGERNRSLDGIRMIAVTLVVASHTNILNQGGLGNAIFFCLSGFFAAMPFVENGEKRYLSARYTLNYYFGRIFRILPLYYFILLTVKFLTGGKFFASKTVLFQNMIFTNCTGHLWFLQQEMLMYLILPLLMLLLTGIKLMVRCKYNDLVCVAVLLIITFLTWKYLTVNVFSLRANNGNGVFRIWQFTVGMAAAYVYRAYKISNLQWNKHRSVRMIFDVLALLLLLGCVLSSNSVLSRFDERFAKYYIGWQLPLWCSSLTGILILLLLLNPTGFLSKLLGNKVFVFLGKISFGIYLIHFFLIPYVSLGSAYKNFICIYGVSTCIAYALHILIEKPFTVFAKTKSLKQLLEYYQNL